MPWDLLALLFWVLLLSVFFAMVEIQIEGQDGWAAGLPTWRVEDHWLLDLLWGGRPMTGYHAWAFPFILLFFHLPLFFMGTVTWLLEARVLGTLMLFWITEDFLWFVFNPAYGLRRFRRGQISWHKNWVLFMPIEYWIFSILGMWLVVRSYGLVGWPL